MHQDLHLNVVVDKGLHRVAPAVAALVQETQLVTRNDGDRAVFIIFSSFLEVKGRDRQVVENHPHAVPLADPRGQELGLLFSQRRRKPLGQGSRLVLARPFCPALDFHAQVVGRVLLAEAREERARVRGARGAFHSLWRAAEGQGVVVVRELGLFRSEGVDLDWREGENGG